jgi:hypothetical protein
MKIPTAQIRALAAALSMAIPLATPAAAATHLGQGTAEHVNVHFFGGMSGGDCSDFQGGSTTLYMQRLHPDGSTTPFSIPKGKVLVVTDFDFSTSLHRALGVRSSLRAKLLLKAAGSGKQGGTIAWQDSFHLTEDLVSKNFAVDGQSLSGIFVADTGALCPAVTFDDGSQEALIITGGNYRGYLIDAGSPPSAGSDPELDPTGAPSDELR